MSVNLFTNLAAAYACYHIPKQIKKYYNEFSQEPQDSLKGRIYYFINEFLHPDEYHHKGIYKAIEKYQWLSHIVYYLLITNNMTINGAVVGAELYFLVSWLTPLLIEMGKDLAPRVISVVKITNNMIQASIYKV